MSKLWESKLPKEKSYHFNKSLPFHLVSGDGGGGVLILIEKSVRTWIYRMLRFGEISRFVHDSSGAPLVFNNIDLAIAIIERRSKVYARYDINLVEWEPEKYNEAWFGGMHGGEPTTEKALIKDPFHFWVKGYKAHFVLEEPKGKREHFSYYKPV